MSDETIKQMEDRWFVQMSATNPKTGQRVTEYDLKYARECHALRVQIEERKTAETSRPQINQQQLEQLAWLDRVQGAKDKSGKRLHDEFGGKHREWVDNARRWISSGNAIEPAVIAETEANYAKEGVSLPAPNAPREYTAFEKAQAGNSGLSPLPPAHFHTNALPQQINTRVAK